MSDQVSLGVFAIAIGLILGALGFVPYVAISYRRHGRLAARRLVLAFALLVYFLAIWTYTLLPLPDPDAIRCTTAQLDVGVLPRDLAAAFGSGHPLTHPAFLQIALNVLLFLPLGFFLRLIWRRGWITAVLVGFALSLLVETTQLTGVWGIYPCGYRLFDVEDLITNTLGALLGSILSLAIPPRLRSRNDPDPDAALPTLVTAARRLVAMICDFLSVVLTGLAVGVLLAIIDVAFSAGTVTTVEASWYDLVGNLVPFVVTLVYMMTAGRTIGHAAAQLRYTGSRLPAFWSRLLRFLGGIGGFQLIGLLPEPWSIAQPVFLVLSLVLVFTTKDHRGLPGIVSGQRLVDSRVSASDTVPA